MSTRTKTRKKIVALPDTFEALTHLLMPRTIHDNIELKNAQEMIDALAISPQLNTDQLDYLETLADLVEAFEKHKVLIASPSGVETLRFLLAENNLNATALSRILGVDTSLGYRIVDGGRNLTLSHARKLGQHFRVAYTVFL